MQGIEARRQDASGCVGLEKQEYKLLQALPVFGKRRWLIATILRRCSHWEDTSFLVEDG
ncbi:hypothetical protein [Bradyrhizobium yuanmingense]|uniref:hypothetical protein n=1 Tax=Bradyrhizobium yuanmingense TaxID=108015 RepID=UPI0023B940F1|nr:hypothetical protein [Bradyrhizobium yuanmingense]MDF0584743.1 hypothetical protein [Bradyrhizobium yuanmingense]